MDTYVKADPEKGVELQAQLIAPLPKLAYLVLIGHYSRRQGLLGLAIDKLSKVKRPLPRVSDLCLLLATKKKETENSLFRVTNLVEPVSFHGETRHPLGSLTR